MRARGGDAARGPRGPPRRAGTQRSRRLLDARLRDRPAAFAVWPGPRGAVPSGAGRVRAGVCWRLWPKGWDAALPAHAAPEMLRTPLQDLSLQILTLNLGQPRDFLAAAPQPPAPTAVDAALEDLRAIGCVARDDDDDDDAPAHDESSDGDGDNDDENPHGADDELFAGRGAVVAALLREEDAASSDDAGADDDVDTDVDAGDADDADDADDAGARGRGATRAPATTWRLTALGRHVAGLPVDCRVAKLLVYGCVFGCADACLAVAAGGGNQTARCLQAAVSFVEILAKFGGHPDPRVGFRAGRGGDGAAARRLARAAAAPSRRGRAREASPRGRRRVGPARGGPRARGVRGLRAGHARRVLAGPLPRREGARPGR